VEPTPRTIMTYEGGSVVIALTFTTTIPLSDIVGIYGCGFVMIAVQLIVLIPEAITFETFYGWPICITV
jgi:hypothetical protein